LLEVNIEKSLPGFNLDVAFSVNNEILAILGPSGSGKTMTLQCIAGLVNPDRGYIRLDDNVIFDSASKTNLNARNRKVGLVFQNYALFPHLTVSENIAFGITDRPSDERRRIVDDLIDKMELDGLSKRYPRQLSAGQQQRVALARALAPEPDVLLLDEPFSALDTQTKEHLEPQILAIKQFYKGSILFVTHDVSEAFRLCSRIAVYEKGGIVQCDEKARLISSPANVMVARLTGFRNLLPGTITGTDDSDIWIEVPHLGTLRALLHKNSCLTSGMEVTIGIRPEHMKITDCPGENSLPGTVDRITEELNGKHWFLRVNDGHSTQHNMEAVVSVFESVTSSQSGNGLYVHIPPEHIVVINKRK
jgi:molybdate transport system ATP-binding protein